MLHEDKKILGKLRHEFSPAEMQVIVGGAMGHDLRNRHLIDILAPQLSDSGSTLSLIKSKNRLKVDLQALLHKLETSEPADLVVLQRTVESLLQQAPSELIGKDGLPSINALRVAGLVVPSNKAGWGFCVVVLEDAQHVEEIVLHHKPGESVVEGKTIDEIAECVVEITRTLLERRRLELETALFQECYSLALATGWRFIRVLVREGQVEVVEIPTADLLADLSDGSLRALVLPGVNAPSLPVGHS